jgi:hypothetical protein
LPPTAAIVPNVQPRNGWKCAECFIFQIHGSVRDSHPLSQKTPETKATGNKTQMRRRWEVNITLMKKDKLNFLNPLGVMLFCVLDGDGYAYY